MDGKPSRAAAFLKLLMAAWFLLFLVSAARAESAPDFALKDVSRGQQYTLSQFKGKVVLLNFFTFLCGPCREEMPHLNEINKELQSRGFQTLGIGLASEVGQLRTLAQQLGLDYPVLLGNDEVAKAYGRVELVPTTFIIDKQGNIVHKILGARTKENFLSLIRPLL